MVIFWNSCISEWEGRLTLQRVWELVIHDHDHDHLVPRSGVWIYQIVTGVTSVVGVPSTHQVCVVNILQWIIVLFCIWYPFQWPYLTLNLSVNICIAVIHFIAYETSICITNESTFTFAFSLRLIVHLTNVFYNCVARTGIFVLPCFNCHFHINRNLSQCCTEWIHVKYVMIMVML